MAPTKLHKYAHHIHCLNAASAATCKAIIKTADKGLVNCLCEVCLNVLKGNVPVTTVQKRKLSRHKADLRRLIKKNLSLNSKKRILQKGGFLGALLGPLVGGLGKVILPALAGAFLK